MNIKKLIESTFPNLSVNLISDIGSGMAGGIYLINGEIVFKIPLHKDASDNIPKEAAVLKAVHGGGLGIETPKLLYFGTSPDGLNILGESVLPGVTFSKGIYDALSVDKKNRILEQIGGILRRMHDMTDEANNLPIPLHTIESHKDFYLKFYQDFVKSALTAHENNRIENLFRRFMESEATDLTKRVLCHGDAHFENFMFDPVTETVSGVFDFGDACYSHPAYDLRYLWGDGWPMILRGYGRTIGKDTDLKVRFFNLCNFMYDAVYENDRGQNPGFHISRIRESLKTEIDG